MTNLFRDRSIRSKLTVMTMFTTAIALLVACAGFAVFDFSTYRQALVDQMVTHANIIGGNSTSALAFDDIAEANETLSTLAAENNVQAACIYDDNGAIFATYTTPAFRAYTFPSNPESNAHRFGSGFLEVFRDIHADGRKVGAVYLRSDLDALYARSQSYIGIGAMLVLFSGLVAFPLAKHLQRFVSDPIQHLAGTAKTISIEKNYSLRA